MACAADSAQIVQLLLDASASTTPMTAEGETPLHICVRNGCAETVRALLGASAAVDALTPSSDCCLHMAAQAVSAGSTAHLAVPARGRARCGMRVCVCVCGCGRGCGCG